MLQHVPAVFLMLAVALTFPLFLSIFSEQRAAHGAQPAFTTMVASAICPVAAALCFLSHPFALGLALVAMGIALSLLIGHIATRPLAVALGALSMGVYLHWEWLPT